MGKYKVMQVKRPLGELKGKGYGEAEGKIRKNDRRNEYHQSTSCTLCFVQFNIHVKEVT